MPGSPGSDAELTEQLSEVMKSQSSAGAAIRHANTQLSADASRTAASPVPQARCQDWRVRSPGWRQDMSDELRTAMRSGNVRRVQSLLSEGAEVGSTVSLKRNGCSLGALTNADTCCSHPQY